ncbi:hypothetical protein SCB71_17075 [Herbiconiux sp. KACC 21604]|uniref:hypothetical protein n=1 Tax=unclassified Herbiconiux TaxID=2618217 RepID=UPI001492CE2A|nr:hypothetical protein [Herbiconiux sp. SALV-R1]QJU54800.1 hypothetical protein HL652_15030 [Herbiconiux sp. SALV-R1]WPO85914.1 hypothetical protein SCB71_17075 [Herbiconiux sp. KACC 21604]
MSEEIVPVEIVAGDVAAPLGDAELAREIDAAVLAVPGVLQTYDGRSTVGAVLAGAAAVLRKTDAPLPVMLRRTGDTVSVSVRIAVGGGRLAADTCREVYSVVSELAAARLGEATVVDVSVEVARIG